MPVYSFAVPIYNDGYLVRPFCEAMEKEMRFLLGTDDLSRDLEVIFINDGSHDDSQRLLVEAAKAFAFVKVIELSRNFGQHVAVSCGYRFATGDYVAMINVDMQDAPDQFGVLIKSLQEGSYDIVVGLRHQREDSWHKDLTSRAFNALLNTLYGCQDPLQRGLAESYEPRVRGRL